MPSNRATRRAHLGPRQQPAGAHRRDRRRRLDADDRGRHLQPAGAGGSSARARPASNRWSSITATRRRATASIARWSQELADARRRLVCLAGFMRLVGAPLLDAFPNRSSTSTRRCCRRFPASTHSVRRRATASRSPARRCTSSPASSTAVRSSCRLPSRCADDDTPTRWRRGSSIEEHRSTPRPWPVCWTVAGASRPAIPARRLIGSDRRGQHGRSAARDGVERQDATSGGQLIRTGT